MSTIYRCSFTDNTEGCVSLSPYSEASHLMNQPSNEMAKGGWLLNSIFQIAIRPTKKKKKRNEKKKKKKKRETVRIEEIFQHTIQNDRIEMKSSMKSIESISHFCDTEHFCIRNSLHGTNFTPETK